jgi:hypothetical protein
VYAELSPSLVLLVVVGPARLLRQWLQVPLPLLHFLGDQAVTVQ